MIEGAAIEHQAHTVSRLIALPPENVDAILLKRGIDPASINEALQGLRDAEVPVSAADAVEFSFRPRDGEVPYSTRRFGDGTWPIYYSALEEETCVAELSYWQGAALTAQNVFHSRYFYVVECDFDGEAMMLVGYEGAYPDLISPTESGYPFCRAVARWAIDQGAHSLFTRSARRPEGTCVPVFVRARLSNERRGARYRFSAGNNNVMAERTI